MDCSNSFRRPRTIHLYIGEYFKEVQELTTSTQTDNNGMDDNEDETLEGVWLIQVRTPEYQKEEMEMQRVFELAPMRFDSLVFAFYKTNIGNETNYD